MRLPCRCWQRAESPTAADGIADGRGLLVALALGAEGIWMGTRFVASFEAYAHVNYKNKIVEIDEEGTTITAVIQANLAALFVTGLLIHGWGARLKFSPSRCNR
jgi:hypothetical protein